MNKYFVFISILVHFLHSATAQDIQWCSGVKFHYNGVSLTREYSAHQIIGEPDAQPFGQKSPNAFTLKQDSTYGIITASFQKPMLAREAYIVESYLPGRISKVVAEFNDGSEYVLYSGITRDLKQKARVLTLNIPRTSQKLRYISVHLNTMQHTGMAQIDAIGISKDKNGEPYITGMEAIKDLDPWEELNHIPDKAPLKGSIAKTAAKKPVVSLDGNKFYFLQPVSSTKKGVFYTELSKNNLTEAIQIGPDLDNSVETIASVSPNGNKIWLTGSKDQNGRNRQVLVSTTETENGWTPLEEESIEGLGSGILGKDFYIAGSGNVLLLSGEGGANNVGGKDIFVSFRQDDNSWSKPQNLGKIINTQTNEISPFLAADNKTLYFASDGHGGYGKSDIFYSIRRDDSWTSWTEPTNLGSKINSYGDESNYATSGKGDYGYFVSKKDDDQAESEEEKENQLYGISIPEIARPKAVVMIRGYVWKESDNVPVPAATVEYESLPIGKDAGIALSNRQSGAYSLGVPAGMEYGFSAHAKGYESDHQKLDFSNITEYTEIEVNLYLSQLSVGQVTQLKNLFFVQSKAEILPESRPELDKLANLLKTKPTLVIELSGHTDSHGNRDANQKLSEMRAEAVKQYLVDKGVDKKRIKAVGYGSSRPISGNDDPTTRVKNRRVEVKVLSM